MPSQSCKQEVMVVWTRVGAVGMEGAGKILLMLKTSLPGLGD